MHIARHRSAIVLLCAVWLAGCVTHPESRDLARGPFDFHADTFSYSNELVWEYRVEGTRVITTKREPRPTYTHRCFVVVRAAHQFFNHARFDPSLPRATNYQSIVRTILSRSPRTESSADTKVVVPGYANLRAFSEDHSALLQAHCGGAWQSYFQRGHWRMIFPFTRGHQQRTARKLLAQVQDDQPRIVHIVRFPSLSINHALLLYAAEATDSEIRFHAYDPNYPQASTLLTFREKERRFFLPANHYFPHGGRVDVYPIFTGLLY